MLVNELLAKCISINSVNPSLDASAPGERVLAEFIAEFGRSAGLQTQFQKVEGERKNVLTWVDGTDASERLLFVAHLDTVPVNGWIESAFSPRLVGDRIYGRGASDTKASLAAMLTALQSIRDKRPRATIVVAGSVDEEYEKKGARALAGLMPRFSAAVVGEPTSLELVVAHKGSVRCSITTSGRAAHTSVPELGENAIVEMAHVIGALSQYGHELRTRPHALVGPASLTVSLTRGGTDICTVPAFCEISIDRRLVPGENVTQVIGDIEELLDRLRRDGVAPNVSRMAKVSEDPPLNAGAGSRIVDVAQAACEKYAGTGSLKGVPYGTDASKLNAAGIPCVVLGPGSIAQAHTIDEYIDVGGLQTAVEIYRDIMLSY